MSKEREQLEPALVPTCERCTFVRTFKPRPDERERYGFGEVGYECRKLNYEGYTQADGWCPSFYGKRDAQ